MSEPVLLNPRHPRLWHGGDYNPEQWPRPVWDEDMRLMLESRFAVCSIGIFSWAQLEPYECQYDFEWLDEVVRLLTEHDRWFLLSTPSAAPPAWLSMKYPETLRTGEDRVRRLHGNRVNYNLSSPIYRQKVEAINRELALRYGKHPRLLAWHISNEYGGADYGAESAAAFQAWLRNKFNGDIDALNHAYWSAFWSHSVREWDEIEPPGPPYGESATPGLTVDWRRFNTDQTIDFMLAEMAPLREIAPDVPVTTNLMGTYAGLDYRKLSKHIDFVSWDSYPGSATGFTDPVTWTHVAFTHDLMRSLKPWRSWLLMESSPSSANWYPFMILKPTGTHRFEGLQAVAHGSDGVQYFQWRQGRGGHEQFHGAVVSHAGAEGTRVFEEVRAIGQELEALDDVAGSTVHAETAIFYDWENRWAIEAASGPSHTTRLYEQTVRAHYLPLWEKGVPVDLIGLDDELDKYRLVIAPMLYSLRPDVAERLEQFVERGGTLLVTYLSGWVDENSLVFEGGFLAPLRKLLGIWSEELDVLPTDRTNAVLVPGDDSIRFYGSFQARDFCELIHVESATVLGTYSGGGFYEGSPAFTVNSFGQGRAYYVASRNEPAFIKALTADLVSQADVQTVMSVSLPDHVTAQARRTKDTEFVFLMNAADAPAIVPTEEWGEIDLGPRDVRVVTRRLGAEAP